MIAFPMRGALAFFCLVLLSAGVACAHTFVFINSNPYAATWQPEHLVSSTPAANTLLAKAPEAIVMTFSSPINPDKSSIKVYDLYGTQINDGTVTVNGAAMSANLPPLSSGRYAVKWKTRCMCTGKTDLSNEFHFTVR